MRVSKVFWGYQWDQLSTNVQMSLLQHKVSNCLIRHSHRSTICIGCQVHSSELLSLRLTIFRGTCVEIHGNRAKGNISITSFSGTHTSAVLFREMPTSSKPGRLLELSSGGLYGNNLSSSTVTLDCDVEVHV